jgi:hypothetical protein
MLNPEFFSIGLPEKKVYLYGMSILSILLSLESGCHISPSTQTCCSKAEEELKYFNEEF